MVEKKRRYVTMEVEIGVVPPQGKAKDCSSLQKEDVQGTDPLLEPRGKQPYSRLDFRFQSYKRLNLCVLSH